tara:strand:+ start:309 stop:872 length:564 start_codon:yes stop_codon:yes gene_type:complete
MRITLVTLIILLISSCSIPFLKEDIKKISYSEYKNLLEINNDDKFKFNGKLSFFINKKGQTGKIFWEHKNDKDIIHILNPFNTKVAEIILLNSEKKISINFAKDNKQNSDQIISKIFGDEKNIFILKQFITRPPSIINNKNKILINYQSWNIYYHGKKVFGNKLLPNIIEFEKNNVYLKIFISEWTS